MRITNLATALDAARALVEFLEALTVSASLGGQLSTSSAGAGAETTKALATPEGMATLEAWIQEAQASSPANAMILPKIVRDRCLAEGDAAGLARLCGYAREHFGEPFEEEKAKAKRQNEEDASRQIEAQWKWQRDHPLADARERLQKIAREKKKTGTDTGRFIPKHKRERGPRIGRGHADPADPGGAPR